MKTIAKRFSVLRAKLRFGLERSDFLQTWFNVIKRVREDVWVSRRIKRYTVVAAKIQWIACKITCVALKRAKITHWPVSANGGFQKHVRSNVRISHSFQRYRPLRPDSDQNTWYSAISKRPITHLSERPDIIVIGHWCSFVMKTGSCNSGQLKH